MKEARAASFLALAYVAAHDERMAIDTKIKFVQGVTIGVPGVALIGTTGTKVTASNGSASNDPSSVSRYVWTMLDKPALSALVSGLIVDGPVTSIDFVPDVPGDYHLECIAYGIDGRKSVDRRVFRVLLPSGRAIPSFDAEAPAMNFGGQTRGWAPDMETWFVAVESGVAGGFGSTVERAGSGTLNDVSTMDGGSYAGALRMTGTPAVAGLGQGADRRWLIVHFPNGGSLKNEAGTSSANNRITTGVGDMTIPAGGAVLCAYDPFASRWRVAAAAGSGNVADDVAKSAGTTIDRVRGLRGVTISGADGAPDVGASIVYNAVGSSSYKRKKQVGWFDVTDYGAVADGVTDCTAAFQAAIAAAGAVTPYESGAPGAPFGGVVYVPPASGQYYLASNLEINREMWLMGQGIRSQHMWSVLKFAPGCGIVLYAYSNSTESGGRADWSRISGLRIRCQPLTLPIRPRNTAVSLGYKMRLSNDNRFYYECTTAGTTADVAESSCAFGDSTSPLSGGEFPSSAGRRLNLTTVDGTVTWTCKEAAGILSYVSCDLHDLQIDYATNAGISLHGNTLTDTNTNHSTVRNVRIQTCGVGVHIFGGDANGMSFSDIVVNGAGFNYGEGVVAGSGLGGFGYIDASFLGCLWSNVAVEDATGAAIWTPTGVLGMSTFVGCYTENSRPSYINGLVLGGDHGAGFASGSAHTGYNWIDEGWRNIKLQLTDENKSPTIQLDDRSKAAFLVRVTDDDPGYANIADRYYSADVPGDGVGVGSWVTGIIGVIGERRILGYTASGHYPTADNKHGGSPEGVGNLRVFRGYFAGDGAAPYYVGLADNSDKDLFVRYNQGVGGHFKPGDRFEPKSDGQVGSYIGKVVATEGWDTGSAWTAAAPVVTYFHSTGWAPSSTQHPTTPNGYTYVCNKAGTTGGSEPTWPTTYLGSGGIVPVTWPGAGYPFKVNQYCVPTVRNGHYYKVTSVSGADLDGYGVTGSPEPTWPTGSGATVTDGDLTWTEQGADTGTYVADGTAEWTCVGPVPTYNNYGEIV